MCSTCGCGPRGGTRIKFFVEGYTAENAKAVEKDLLGLPGVMHVHIHAHDGETAIDYIPAKTPLSELTGALSKRGLTAVL